MDREPQPRGSSVGLWIGLLGGGFGVIALAVSLFFVFRASEREANPAVAETKDDTAKDAQKLVADKADKPAVEPLPEPTPTLPPNAQGVIPAPPDPNPENANRDPLLKYRWKPGQVLGYQFSRRYGIGDVMKDQRGVVTYRVIGPDPVMARQFIEEDEVGSGTAFVVHPDGYLVTCEHVVERAKSIEVTLGETIYAARVIAQDTERDLALIRISARNLPVLPLSDSSQVKLAQNVRAIGFPAADLLGTDVKVTQGSVTGFPNFEGLQFIQVDASINPGNSGGPIVNDKGEVVGVGQSVIDAFGITNVGLTVPSNDVKSLLEDQGIQPQTSGAEQKLDGPELARRTTPAVAFLKVSSGEKPRECVVIDFTRTLVTTNRQKNDLVVPGSTINTETVRGKFLVDEYGQILRADSNNEDILRKVDSLDHPEFAPLSHEGDGFWLARQLKIFNRRKTPPGQPARDEDEFLAMEFRMLELGETSLNMQQIEERYDLRTLGEGNPYNRIFGSGEIQFNRLDGLCESAEYELKFEVTTKDNITLQVPVTLKSERLSEASVDRFQSRVAHFAKIHPKHPELLVMDELYALPVTRNIPGLKPPTANTPPNPLAGTRSPRRPPITKSLDENLAFLKDPAAGFSKRFVALHEVQSIPLVEDRRKEVLDAVEPLLKDPALRMTAIATFGVWGTEDRADALIKLVEDADLGLRWAAMKSLGKIGGKKSAEAVVKRLTDSNDKLTAARALAEMGPVAEEPVSQLIDHADPTIRREVYGILGKVGGEDSRKALEEKSQSDPVSYNRAAASIALRALDKGK